MTRWIIPGMIRDHEAEEEDQMKREEEMKKFEEHARKIRMDGTPTSFPMQPCGTCVPYFNATSTKQ